MAVSDYTGRSVDLLVVQGTGEERMRRVTLGLGGAGGGQITTGVQKAAQLFLVLFLTEKGSRMHDSEFGTRFLTTAKQSNMNDALMQVTFREAAEDILAQQARYRDTDTPDDEILSDIELLSFTTPSPAEMSIVTKLTTVAGITRQVIVPISLAIK